MVRHLEVTDSLPNRPTIPSTDSKLRNNHRMTVATVLPNNRMGKHTTHGTASLVKVGVTISMELPLPKILATISTVDLWILGTTSLTDSRLHQVSNLFALSTVQCTEK